MNPEVAQFEALGKELLRRCMAEEEPEDLRKWLTDTLARMGGADGDALMTWERSFDFVEEMIAKYEEIAQIPESQRKVLSWPWWSWNNLIDPLEEGMLGVVSAPDGLGKTIYAESLSEHWAMHKNRVVFVHYELSRNLMMLRRTARHTGIETREIKAGHLTPAKKEQVREAQKLMRAYEGNISYVHTPGWTMERTIAEMHKLHADGLCDVVVLDYLEKAFSSVRQLKMYGTNTFQREADNVEQLKIFSESTGVPVMMVAQMSKEGKGKKSDEIDRGAMRGAGEKSEKANLVVLLTRDRIDEGYSNTVSVMVDKNTMGKTGSFIQIMQPEFFRVGDPRRTP